MIGKKCKSAVSIMNKKKLTENCIEKVGNTEKVKTKTKYILDQINDDSYSGKPLPAIISSNKLRAKTLIIAQSGMLECGKNFRATIPETCSKCMLLDDENHRMNECLNWNHLNSLGGGSKIDFHDVYSSDPHKLSVVIDRIRCVWELSLGKGTMRRRVFNSEHIPNSH